MTLKCIEDCFSDFGEFKKGQVIIDPLLIEQLKESACFVRLDEVEEDGNHAIRN